MSKILVEVEESGLEKLDELIKWPYTENIDEKMELDDFVPILITEGKYSNVYRKT